MDPRLRGDDTKTAPGAGLPNTKYRLPDARRAPGAADAVPDALLLT
jgi:hypothetical protein